MSNAIRNAIDGFAVISEQAPVLSTILYFPLSVLAIVIAIVVAGNYLMFGSFYRPDEPSNIKVIGFFDIYIAIVMSVAVILFLTLPGLTYAASEYARKVEYVKFMLFS